MGKSNSRKQAEAYAVKAKAQLKEAAAAKAKAAKAKEPQSNWERKKALHTEHCKGAKHTLEECRMCPRTDCGDSKPHRWDRSFICHDKRCTLGEPFSHPVSAHTSCTRCGEKHQFEGFDCYREVSCKICDTTDHHTKVCYRLCRVEKCPFIGQNEGYLPPLHDAEHSNASAKVKKSLMSKMAVQKKKDEEFEKIDAEARKLKGLPPAPKTTPPATFASKVAAVAKPAPKTTPPATFASKITAVAKPAAVATSPAKTPTVATEQMIVIDGNQIPLSEALKELYAFKNAAQKESLANVENIEEDENDENVEEDENVENVENIEEDEEDVEEDEEDVEEDEDENNYEFEIPDELTAAKVLLQLFTQYPDLCKLLCKQKFTSA